MKFYRFRFGKRLGVLLLFVAMAWMVAGCDDSEFDYEPPAGKGALIVDNFTGDRVLVYIDGEEMERVSSGRHRAYDCLPGVRRVALDSEDIRRSWAGDVDILEGRRTVAEVRGDYVELDYFDVRVFFD